MTLYAEFVVCFDEDCHGECKDETIPAHHHIAICEAYHGEMGETIQDEIIFDEWDDTVKDKIMAQMCRKAIKLNKEKPRKID